MSDSPFDEGSAELQTIQGLVKAEPGVKNDPDNSAAAEINPEKSDAWCRRNGSGKLIKISLE